MPPDRTNERILEPWRIRLLIVCLTVGGLTMLVVLAGLTWAIFAIREDRAGMTRVQATIVSVDSSKRESWGRSVKFGTYDLTVRYKDSDGREVTDRLEKRTFGFPSAGDSITLLVRRGGGIEANPMPEVLLLVGAVYAGFGWLVWLAIRYVMPVIRMGKAPARSGRIKI